MKKLLFSIILLGFTGCVVSETLPCGQSLFQTGAFEQLVLYNGPGSQPAKLDIITVKHPEFNKAFRIKVQDKQKEPWDNSLTANNSKPVKKKDIVFVSYLARKTGTDTGQGYLQTTMSEPMPSFLPLAALDQTLTDQWTHGKLAFKANYDYKPNEIQLSFQLGFYSQTVEIADVKFVNLGSDTNIKGLGLSADVVIHNAKRKQMTYEGRDPNAPWRKEAFERIEKVRKGDLTITVKDKNDNPLPNAKVTVKQLKHKFWFGNEIRALTIIGDAGYLNSRNITAADSQKYMETVKELFNVTAFGQAMVWFYWDKHGRQTTKQVYDEFLKPNDIALRGIPLVWSGRQEWKNPKGLVDLPSEKLREKIKQHVIEMLEVHKGNAVMWDVLNEPISEPDFINKLGKDEAVKWFKLVRKLEPKAKLYCNEYGLLQDKEKLEKFIELIKYLKENGAPIDGVSPCIKLPVYITE